MSWYDRSLCGRPAFYIGPAQNHATSGTAQDSLTPNTSMSWTIADCCSARSRSRKTARNQSEWTGDGRGSVGYSPYPVRTLKEAALNDRYRGRSAQRCRGFEGRHRSAAVAPSRQRARVCVGQVASAPCAADAFRAVVRQNSVGGSCVDSAQELTPQSLRVRIDFVHRTGDPGGPPRTSRPRAREYRPAATAADPTAR